MQIVVSHKQFLLACAKWCETTIGQYRSYTFFKATLWTTFGPTKTNGLNQMAERLSAPDSFIQALYFEDQS